MIEVRDAVPEELPAAGDVAVEGYREFYGEALGWYADHLRDAESRAKDAAIIVAVEDGDVVGTVTYVSDATSSFAEQQRPDEGSIRMLSVHPAHKRRGIGRALSIECIERARAEGKRGVVLHADESMTVARRMYEQLGFRRDLARDFRSDDETALVCYVLDLV